jgi:hypothetical protein
MLSITTYLTTDIPPLPLLWGIPLALYLLAFIIAFARRTVISPRIVNFLVPILLIVVPLSAWLTHSVPVWIVFLLHLVAFFFMALACDSALAGDRPSAHHLTEFYLWISVGGAVGGVLNPLIAPRIFPLPLEYPVWLAAAALLLMTGNDQPSRRQWVSIAVPGILIMLVLPIALSVLRMPVRALPLAAGLVFGLPALLELGLRQGRSVIALRGLAFFVVALFYAESQSNVIHVERSFFGINYVVRQDDPISTQLMHSTTLHGMQSGGMSQECEPLTYFARTGPIGQTMTALQKIGKATRVGVLGLGAGSLAGYMQPGEDWVFYEIDPAVERIARNPEYFTFLVHCAPDANVILGDGRLTLARQPARRHDLIIVDAYNSDAPPVHLMTREAMALHLEKLAPGGFPAFNISNRHFGFKPVIAALARDAGLTGLVQYDAAALEAERRSGKAASEWVLLARTPSDFGALARDPRWQPLPDPGPFPVWIDDYSSVLLALRQPSRP